MDINEAARRQILFGELRRLDKARKEMQIGLQEAISDLNFIRTATNDAQIAALAGSAALVAEAYLKQAKGER
jgi:hypothetical protein